MTKVTGVRNHGMRYRERLIATLGNGFRPVPSIALYTEFVLENIRYYCFLNGQRTIYESAVILIYNFTSGGEQLFGYGNYNPLA